MAKKAKHTTKKTVTEQDFISMPVKNPYAAGIDIGGRSHFVCVAQDNVKEFGAFTEDLHSIAKHLQKHKIRKVALESTGPYWKQIFVLLQDYGFEVILVNARHLKNVKGHKTDVVDSKWIQLLHSIGILSNSFQPDSFTEELRTFNRQRQYLVRNASRYISKMKKNFILMNIRLDNVLSDITGKSGMTVIKAILSGDTDVNALSKLFNGGVKASKEDIKKALTGNWKREYIFELQQSYDLYNFYWEKIRECDLEIEILLEGYMITEEQKSSKPRLEYKPPKKKQKQKNDTNVDIYSYAYQIAGGVDLSEITGVGASLILALTSETGLDLKKDFKTHKHYVSWLGLAPNNKISGGKVLSSHTPKIKSTIRKAYKDAANTVGRTDTPLGEFFRRIAYRRGRSVAIIATARKIATSVYIMLDKKVPYEYKQSEKMKEKLRINQIKNLKRKINNLNISEKELAELTAAA